MRKLIEPSRRKPDFDPEHCTPIKLADGQDWYFPRPWIEIVPHFQDGKAVARSKLITLGPELDILLEAIATEDDPAREMLLVVTLGALLLQRNYDLIDEELERLFTYRPNEQASQDRLRAVIEVATGGLSARFGERAVSDPKA